MLALMLALLVPTASAARPDGTIRLSRFEAPASAGDLEKAAALRLESIARLEVLLTEATDRATRSDMMLRLADLYFQQGRYLNTRELAAFDARVSACIDTAGCDPDQLHADTSGSAQWQEQSVALYQRILQGYPQYARADQATFFLGSALVDLGRADEAAEAFKRVIKLYPDSSVASDAYLQLGEYYFNVADNAYAALKAYRAASAHPEDPKHAYAAYMSAWCYYNVGQFPEAIQSMKGVVDESLEADAEHPVALDLQSEALQDLVQFFADADQLDEAYRYFTAKGRLDLIRTTLKRLATVFSDEGKFDQAAETYRRLILDQPSAKDNPGYQAALIGVYQKEGDRSRVLQEVDRLRVDYGPDSPWARANAGDPAAVDDARARIEVALRGVAEEYHNQAKRLAASRQPEAPAVYAQARSAYAAYLGLFPQNEHSYTVRYEYAELLYQIGDYPSAFDQYLQVVDLDPKGDKSEFCAESAVFAAEAQVKREAATPAPVDPAHAADPQPLTVWEQRFVDACHKYASLYASPKVTGMLFRSAYLLYGKHRFEEASAQFQAVIAMDPGSKDAKLAAHLILDALNVQQSWEALYQTAKAFDEQPGLGDAAFKVEVHDIYARSAFKRIEVRLAHDDDLGAAADGFVGFYQAFADSPVAAQALNNAAAYYAQATRIGDEMRVRHLLLEDPRFGAKSRYYLDQVASLGFDYEQIADDEQASTYYEELWSLSRAKGVDEAMRARAATAMFSAGVLRAALGDPDRAIADDRAFADAYPQDPRTAEVLLRIGQIHEDQGRLADAARVYRALYQAPPPETPVEDRYFARLRCGRALEALGKPAERDALYVASVAQYRKDGAPPAAAELVAEMMFTLAQPALERYQVLRIERRGATGRAGDQALSDSLARKVKAQVAAERTLTAVIDTGSGRWGLASLVALGRTYEELGAAMLAGDRPDYLDPAQLEMYDMRLQDAAYLQQEKAAHAYALALQKSAELTLYDDDTAYALGRLAALHPDDGPGLPEALVAPRFVTGQAERRYPLEPSP